MPKSDCHYGFSSVPYREGFAISCFDETATIDNVQCGGFKNIAADLYCGRKAIFLRTSVRLVFLTLILYHTYIKKLVF